MPKVLLCSKCFCPRQIYSTFPPSIKCAECGHKQFFKQNQRPQ